MNKILQALCLILQSPNCYSNSQNYAVDIRRFCKYLTRTDQLGISQVFVFFFLFVFLFLFLFYLLEHSQVLLNGMLPKCSLAMNGWRGQLAFFPYITCLIVGNKVNE